MKNTNKKRIFWTQISRPKPLNFVILVFKKNDFPFSCFKMLLVIPYKEENGSKEKNANGTPVQKYRDLLKSAAIMSDGQTNYLLLGIENQSEIHYAMPVRNALYDALQYSRQIEDTAARHRSQKDYSGHSSGEFLSGFFKENRLIPVITLVIFFGPRHWDGPRSLHEMMAVKDPEILNLTENYRIHLLEPASLTPEDLDKFQTSLRDVLEFIKYSEDKKKLQALLNQNQALRHLQHNAADVIRTCTGIYFPLEETQEVIDVCKAIQEMKEDSRSEGMLTHARKTALNLWNSGMPLAQIADMVEYPADQVQQWLQEAGKC